MFRIDNKVFDALSRLRVGLVPTAVLLLLPAFASAQAVSEAQLKAAFIYNFSKYADLPEANLPSETTFVICVLGEQGTNELSSTVRGKTIDERIIEVRKLSLTDIEQQQVNCQMVFISGVVSEPVQSLLTISQQRGILTVGDNANFCKAGGIINFYPQDNKVRFEISMKNAETSGIKLSSQLLKLARIVDE